MTISDYFYQELIHIAPRLVGLVLLLVLVGATPMLFLKA